VLVHRLELGRQFEQVEQVERMIISLEKPIMAVRSLDNFQQREELLRDSHMVSREKSSFKKRKINLFN